MRRPWPVPWWNRPRSQHIFTQNANSNYPSRLHWIISQWDWLCGQEHDIGSPMITWHCGLCDDLHKNPVEEVPASQFTSLNSSLVKQLRLLQIRNPSVWFSLYVWALTNSRRGNESHVAEDQKDIRWLSLLAVMEMSNNATQWKQ